MKALGVELNVDGRRNILPSSCRREPWRSGCPARRGHVDVFGAVRVMKALGVELNVDAVANDFSRPAAAGTLA